MIHIGENIREKIYEDIVVSEYYMLKTYYLPRRYFSLYYTLRDKRFFVSLTGVEQKLRDLLWEFYEYDPCRRTL